MNTINSVNDSRLELVQAAPGMGDAKAVKSDAPKEWWGTKLTRKERAMWVVGCLEHEGGCGAEMSGDSRDEVIAKWEKRALAAQEKVNG